MSTVCITERVCSENLSYGLLLDDDDGGGGGGDVGGDFDVDDGGDVYFDHIMAIVLMIAMLMMVVA